MVYIKRLKICFIHPNLGIGGAERLIIDVATALSLQDMDVCFITNQFKKRHAFTELKMDKYPIMIIGNWLPTNICGLFHTVCTYIRMIYLIITYLLFFQRKMNPDIYFVDQIPVAIPILKYWTNRKIMYYCHYPDILHTRMIQKIYKFPINYIEKYATRIADVIIVNSEFTASAVYKKFPNIKNVHILYPTISLNFQNDISKAINKPLHLLINNNSFECNEIIFLSLNRYHPAKNVELAIKAMSALKMKLSNGQFMRVHLIIAGEYDARLRLNVMYYRQLIKFVSKREIGSNVFFIKRLSDKAKAELLKSCDCLLYTPENEHFGIVPLEAMAAKKPVIACNSGGLSEIIDNGVTGFLCEPNEDSFSNCMLKFIDKAYGEEMGLRGFERLDKLYSNDGFSIKIGYIINKLCTNNMK